MKKSIILFAHSLLCLSLIAQPEIVLKSIADKLTGYRDYQSYCTLTFELPHGGIRTVEKEMIVQKNEEDTLCGFFYNFNTSEIYRKVFGDFYMYFNKSVYISKNDEVTKVAFWEEPKKFEREDYYGGAYSPAIQKSSELFSRTPYEIGNLILSTLKNDDATIYQKADTLINGNTCLWLALDVPTVNGWGILYNLIFDKQELYPVVFKQQVHDENGKSTQFTLTTYANTKTNCLSSNYFTEDNLLGKNWWSKAKREETPKITDLNGKQAPEWILPVFGSEDSLSIESLKGKCVLLEFTATWCGHCITAAKFVNKLEGNFKNEKGIEIVSVFCSEFDNKSSIESFNKTHNLKPTILYQAQYVEERYNITSYPSFCIISPEGKVLKSYPGYSEGFCEEIINTLNEYAN